MRILFADDSMTAQNMGKKILTEAGYEVVAVSNGAAAVKKIAEQKPDIIILDIYMPGYTGLEVCDKVRSSVETLRTPVLLTVGKMEPYRAEDANRVKADGVIIKPFEASDLLAVIKKLEERVVHKPAPLVEDTVLLERLPEDVELPRLAAEYREEAAYPEPVESKPAVLDVPDNMATAAAFSDLLGPEAHGLDAGLHHPQASPVELKLAPSTTRSRIEPIAEPEPPAPSFVDATADASWKEPQVPEEPTKAFLVESIVADVPADIEAARQKVDVPEIDLPEAPEIAVHNDLEVESFEKSTGDAVAVHNEPEVADAELEVLPSLALDNAASAHTVPSAPSEPEWDLPPATEAETPVRLRVTDSTVFETPVTEAHNEADDISVLDTQLIPVYREPEDVPSTAAAPSVDEPIVASAKPKTTVDAELLEEVEQQPSVISTGLYPAAITSSPSIGSTPAPANTVEIEEVPLEAEPEDAPVFPASMLAPAPQATAAIEKEPDAAPEQSGLDSFSAKVDAQIRALETIVSASEARYSEPDLKPSTRNGFEHAAAPAAAAPEADDEFEARVAAAMSVYDQSVEDKIETTPAVAEIQKEPSLPEHTFAPAAFESPYSFEYSPPIRSLEVQPAPARVALMESPEPMARVSEEHAVTRVEPEEIVAEAAPVKIEPVVEPMSFEPEVSSIARPAASPAVASVEHAAPVEVENQPASPTWLESAFHHSFTGSHQHQQNRVDDEPVMSEVEAQMHMNGASAVVPNASGADADLIAAAVHRVLERLKPQLIDEIAKELKNGR